MPVNFDMHDVGGYSLNREFAQYIKTHPHYARGHLGQLLNLPDFSDIIKRLKGKIIRSNIFGHSRYFLIQKKDVIFSLFINKPPSNHNCEITIEAASKRSTIAANAINAFKEYFYRFKEQPNAKTAKIIISHRDVHGGANFYERRLDCPRWDEMCNNYANQDEIAELINLDKPYEGGRLVFWHGKPGTGKTFAVRALAQEWKHKAHFLYIVDPESFFNSPGYMFECLLREFHERDDEKAEPDPSKGPSSMIINKDKFKVFVIEDALDFLLEEKRKEMSPAMSRLLNLTEGIIGQGFKLLILITSNEDVGKIDPAFMRPGRCLQRLEFKAFDIEQARKWLEENGIKGIFEEYPDKREWTLADLYAVRFGRKLDGGKKIKPIVGFHK